MERGTQRRKVDALFLAHSIFATFVGSLAFVVPHVFEWFMIHHGEQLTIRGNSDDESKVTHLVIRMYGALILAQAWMTWNARKSDALIRRAMIQAYWFCFTLTTLALLRAQVTPGGHFNDWNWLNIVLFLTLALCYAWFAFFERIAVFEGIDKEFT